jgi:hypothetical protein
MNILVCERFKICNMYGIIKSRISKSSLPRVSFNIFEKKTL